MSRRIYCHDDRLGMRMVANIAARVPHESSSYLIESNAAGFRCQHEFTADPTPGKRRILLFGDSFTVGTGVKASQRFGELLEASLDDVEVYNLGLTGSGTDQQYLAYDHVAKQLHHDLIVLVPWVENIRRNPAHQRVWSDRWADPTADDESVVLQSKPYFELDADGELELHNMPVPRPIPYELFDGDKINTGSRAQRFEWVREFVKTRAAWAKDPLQRLTRLQPVPEYDSADGASWILMRAIIERWHREAAVPMVICPIPMYQHIEGHASPDGYQDRFAELAESNSGLIVHDVLADLSRGSGRERRAMRFTHDIHFTETGHAAFAEALLPAVRSALASAGPGSVPSAPDSDPAAER